MKTTQTHNRASRAFSLVEALATVAIIGIITFLAVPNIVRLRADGERNMAIARAEAFNLGIAAYVQQLGQSAAAADWAPLDTAARYGRIRPYLAFAPAALSDYIRSPYSLDVANYTISASSTSILGKVVLYNTTPDPDEVIPY